MRLFVCGLICYALLVSCSGSSDEGPAEVQGKQDTVHRSADSVVTGHEHDHDGIDTAAFTVTDSTIHIKNDTYPRPSGRVINLLITGIDARLGEHSGRADANHLVRFFLDSGCIEVISIPRGTYADAGFPDTTQLNMIANVRSAKGQSAYLGKVAKIAQVPKIDFWVEFGFSQAIGLLELMGYKDNATSMLRVLRTRKAYATGDFQRSYNQGQFIRQAILRTFDKTDDILGQLAMRAALVLVETNLTYDATQYILSELRSHGFSSSTSERAWVRMKPESISRFQVFDFDSSRVNHLDAQISKRVDPTIPDSAAKRSADYERRLSGIIDRAAADSAKAPRRVISNLSRPFSQRAWLQIKDKRKRAAMKNRICALLISAYSRTGQQSDVNQVQQFLEIDNKATSDR
jgi:anionic cell wall polymer biosynthesis LytR-Cps2A-Psr (LCP) family protein